jgi:hypothetical protein
MPTIMAITNTTATYRISFSNPGLIDPSAPAAFGLCLILLFTYDILYRLLSGKRFAYQYHEAHTKLLQK